MSLGGAAASYLFMTVAATLPLLIAGRVIAGISVVTETVLRSLDALALKPGETLFVSGAAGGIGTAVVQLVVLRGITIIGSASEKNHDYLPSRAGCCPGSIWSGLKERISHLAPEGINAALDVAGSGIIPNLIEMTGSASRVVSVADFSAEEYGARFSKGPPENPDAVLQEIIRLFSRVHYSVSVEKTFRLEDAAKAHEVSENSHVKGKLVIVPLPG
ncbi:zinc-binding dehydrogenase [Rahnella sp. RcJ3]|uniref:zinc-binding dehydrogenase n=1 Tax=Rahnella sp. RcJ3 TaxID=2292446 RepID=UPI0012953439|nr:zinc-binding dehydrogenase [Rahnella sp. RcJ3]MQB55852.1 hypothetical protein [Rahnella sp. RcJ3]